MTISPLTPPRLRASFRTMALPIAPTARVASPWSAGNVRGANNGVGDGAAWCELKAPTEIRP